jgi:probable rRNA maturation factor
MRRWKRRDASLVTVMLIDATRGLPTLIDHADASGLPELMGDNEIGIAVQADVWRLEWPHAEKIAGGAASAVLEYLAHDVAQPAELSVVLGDDALIQELNRTYRDNDSTTNVLAFPLNDANVKVVAMANEGSVQATMMGDVIVAYETVVHEATAQHKDRNAHLAHLVTHGVLHLFGFDHQTSTDLDEMIRAETAILLRLGFDDPYASPAGPLRP